MTRNIDLKKINRELRSYVPGSNPRNKVLRNLIIYYLRKTDPELFTFERLAAVFGIKPHTVFEIFYRERARIEGAPLPRSLKKRYEPILKKTIDYKPPVDN